MNDLLQQLQTIKQPATKDFYHHCQAGHQVHDRLAVDLNSEPPAKIFVYNHERYMGKSEKYCTGQDIISESIDKTGVWEPPETQIVQKILNTRNPDEEVVLDFGTHIGYYSLMAAAKGFEVLSFDANVENLDLLHLSARLNRFSTIHTQLCWLDTDVPVLTGTKKIALLKADVEGAEQWVFKMLQNHFKNQLIAHAIFEISPTFNDSYPALIKDIMDCNYNAYIIPQHNVDTWPEGGFILDKLEYADVDKEVSTWHQENLLFSRQA